MFGIGMPELLLIMAVALIVIGPKKLPDLAKSLGRALGEFKKATSELKESMEIDTPLSDVKRSFDDLNKDLKKNIYEKATGGPATHNEKSPTVQVPPEPYLDKPKEDSESSQWPVDLNHRKQEEQDSAPKEPQPSDIEKEEEPERQVTEAESDKRNVRESAKADDEEVSSDEKDQKSGEV